MHELVTILGYVRSNKQPRHIKEILGIGETMADRLMIYDALEMKFRKVRRPKDPACPIRRQVIPRIEESYVAPGESSDPVGEEGTMPVPGIVHRYPDRVLFLVTDRCASYCRYCTRSRLVSNAQAYDFHPELEQGLQYIAAHPEVRDVLISGGDPLLLSDAKIDALLGRLRQRARHDFIRANRLAH